MSDLTLAELPERIARRITIDPESGCWIWGARSRTRNGYGLVWWERSTRLIHRVTYTLLIGPIPDGLVLDHVKDRGCSHLLCCWPVHLELVTQRENVFRSNGFGATNAAKTRCIRDHEFTPANTRVDKDGWRVCRACRRVRQKPR